MMSALEGMQRNHEIGVMRQTVTVQIKKYVEGWEAVRSGHPAKSRQVLIKRGKSVADIIYESPLHYEQIIPKMEFK